MMVLARLASLAMSVRASRIPFRAAFAQEPHANIAVVHDRSERLVDLVRIEATSSPIVVMRVTCASSARVLTSSSSVRLREVM